MDVLTNFKAFVVEFLLWRASLKTTDTVILIYIYRKRNSLSIYIIAIYHMNIVLSKLSHCWVQGSRLQVKADNKVTDPLQWPHQN